MHRRRHHAAQAVHRPLAGLGNRRPEERLPHRPGNYRPHRHHQGGHRPEHPAGHRERAADHRDAAGGLVHRQHLDGAEGCRARCRDAEPRAGRLRGAVLADVEWAGRRVAPTRTGYCRRGARESPASAQRRDVAPASHPGWARGGPAGRRAAVLRPEEQAAPRLPAAELQPVWTACVRRPLAEPWPRRHRLRPWRAVQRPHRCPRSWRQPLSRRRTIHAAGVRRVPPPSTMPI